MPHIECGKRGGSTPTTSLKINSFKSNYENIACEIGTVVNNVTFNWSYNKSVLSQRIEPIIGALPDPTLKTYSLSNANLSESTIFTLTASDDKTTKTETTTVTFVDPIYIGGLNQTFPPSGDELKDNNKVIIYENKTFEFSFNIGTGYMQICIPMSWNNISKIIELSTGMNSNILGEFQVFDNIGITNTNGDTVLYRVYAIPDLNEFIQLFPVRIEF